MGSPIKTQVENGLSMILDFRGQTIDVYYQQKQSLKILVFIINKERK